MGGSNVWGNPPHSISHLYSVEKLSSDTPYGSAVGQVVAICRSPRRFCWTRTTASGSINLKQFLKDRFNSFLVVKVFPRRSVGVWSTFVIVCWFKQQTLMNRPMTSSDTIAGCWLVWMSSCSRWSLTIRSTGLLRPRESWLKQFNYGSALLHTVQYPLPGLVHLDYRNLYGHYDRFNTITVHQTI